MKFKNTSLTLRSTPTWFCLLVIGAIVSMVLLAACGGSSTTTTSAVATPPGDTNVPVTATPADGTTPTPTPQSKLLSGTQVVMIITNSDGSYGFSPATLTITAGTTVIWKNVSTAPHTVTSDDGTTFDSGTIPTGGSFRFKFTTSGTFSYHCNYHPYMRAKIVL
jgi:plastocyanin